jgi:hypothetical protein
MFSFSFSRSIVFGITLVVALLAISLVILPSSLDLRESPVVSRPAPGKQSRSSSSSSNSHDAANLASTDNMASRRAAPLVFPALSRHTATVIFMHGLGDSGGGWADAVQVWQKKHRLDEVKFILPNARVIPITVVSFRCSCL